MDNKFTITICDENGVKQFNLHQVLKRVALYLVGSIFSLLLLGAAVIVYLNYAINQVEHKKSRLETEYKRSVEKNSALMTQAQQTSFALAEKKEQLAVVNEHLDAIESMIGVEVDPEVSMIDRAQMAKMTTKQMHEVLRNIPNGSPIEYHGITSKFGYRVHPTLGTREFHRGSDMKARQHTPIYAPADAVVEYAGKHVSSGYGVLIILDHNYGFKTLYGHLSKVVCKAGRVIRKGELIGYTGNSGMSNGPHLHYEVRFIQQPLNPFWFVKWDLEHYQLIFDKEKKVPWPSLIAAITHQKASKVAMKIQKTANTALQ